MDFVLARSKTEPPGIAVKLMRSCGLAPRAFLMSAGSVTWPLLLSVASAMLIS